MFVQPRPFCCPRIAVIVALLTAAAAATSSLATSRRPVDCSGTQKIIPLGALELYSVGIANDTINFDTLVTFASGGGGGVDFAEMLNRLHMANHLLNASLNTVETAAVWNATWVELAVEVEAEGLYFLRDGDNISAASALHRASQYYQLAGRYDRLRSVKSLAIYKKSVDVFKIAVQLSNAPSFAWCSPQSIPFNGSVLHAYWCPAAAPHLVDGRSPTIVTVNGFDGTAEYQYYSIVQPMTQRGYNVLVLEGPGQGYTARFNNLYFIPNWEAVAQTGLSFALKQPGVHGDRIFLWGESFGGYLAPRAYAHTTGFRGLISNGGVHDFYQTMLCKMVPFVRDLYLNGSAAATAEVDSIMQHAAEANIGAAFLLEYGALGFNVSTFSGLFDALSAYTMEGSMHLLANKSLLVYDPAFDTLVGNQSQIFFAALPSAAKATLLTLDPYRGTGLHCAVGSTWNAVIKFARWLESVMQQ